MHTREARRSCHKVVCLTSQPARYQLIVWGLPWCVVQASRWVDLLEEWRIPVPAEALAIHAARMGVCSVFLAVCVELLDFPWAWYYNRWAQQPVFQPFRIGDFCLSLWWPTKTSEGSLTNARERLCRRRCCGRCRCRGGHCLCSRESLYHVR